MVTLSKYGAKYNRLVLNLEGLSTDTKPTVYFYEYDANGREVSKMQIQNGSIFTEIDTGNTYMYDAANTTWYQVSISGGGGNSYTKAETDALLADKADLDSDGLVPTSQIPPEVFERMKVVQDDTARFALTTDDVQNGDVVYVNDDEVMYYVYDDTKLNVEAGYKPFAAGTAAKAIADKNGNDITTTYQTTTLGSWTAGQSTSHVTPTGTDTVLQALQKIDNNQRNDETNILSEQAKTTGMSEGGSNYITVGGIRVYVSATAPTGDIPDGSIGVGWHEASEIVHRYQYGEWDGSPAPTYPVYGFKIDKNNDNPDTRVTYLYDAEGMTPAYMDFSNGTFNYGSWANAWFIKNNRPVALKFDGTVDYELNHTDFTKKLDGTTSDVEDSSYNGNFMSEMPTVYVKRWEDNDYNYMAFCEIPYDEDFLAQAHTNVNGDINDYIYLPMFKGSIDANNKLRSLMGTIPNGNTTGTDEVTYASNCGTGWQLWDKAKIDLIMDLIVLITKSTNCRAKIGNGDCQTYNESDTRKDSKNNGADGKMMSGYEVGDSTRSANAQFYGTEGTDSTGYGTHHMIAFYIEDLWGNRWDRCLGFNLVNNVYEVKMTPPYDLNSDNTYQTLDIAPPSSTAGWLKNVSSGVYGDVPTDVGATDTTGFANYFYKTTYSGSRLSLFGGTALNGLKVGRYWILSNGSSSNGWDVGGSPCYNSPI